MRELGEGVAHYTTVHFPTEWDPIFITSDRLDLVIPGGHLETWHPPYFESLFANFGFEKVYADATNAAFEQRCGSAFMGDLSIYDKLREYAIFEKGRDQNIIKL